MRRRTAPIEFRNYLTGTVANDPATGQTWAQFCATFRDQSTGQVFAIEKAYNLTPLIAKLTNHLSRYMQQGGADIIGGNVLADIWNQAKETANNIIESEAASDIWNTIQNVIQNPAAATVLSMVVPGGPVTIAAINAGMLLAEKAADGDEAAQDALTEIALQAAAGNQSAKQLAEALSKEAAKHVTLPPKQIVKRFDALNPSTAVAPSTPAAVTALTPNASQGDIVARLNYIQQRLYPLIGAAQVRDHRRASRIANLVTNKRSAWAPQPQPTAPRAPRAAAAIAPRKAYKVQTGPQSPFAFQTQCGVVQGADGSLWLGVNDGGAYWFTLMPQQWQGPFTPDQLTVGGWWEDFTADHPWVYGRPYRNLEQALLQKSPGLGAAARHLYANGLETIRNGLGKRQVGW